MTFCSGADLSPCGRELSCESTPALALPPRHAASSNTVRARHSCRPDLRMTVDSHVAPILGPPAGLVLRIEDHTKRIREVTMTTFVVQWWVEPFVSAFLP